MTGRDRTMTDAERVAGLIDLAERVIEVHAHVVMDTPEDRDLHDRAVATFRTYLALLRPPNADAKCPSCDELGADCRWSLARGEAGCCQECGHATDDASEVAPDA